ncbi:MAG: amino acid ABC transporter ATP-binding protein, partial [Polyangiaceae bacterium]
MTAPLLVVESVKKKFGDRELLRGVSLELASHSVTALVGPSGCGKSTLLRCINGLETFDEGAVRAGGVAIGPRTKDTASLVALRRKVGFVFQQFNLFAHRTALGNVIEAPLHVKGMDRSAAISRAKSLLERVGLGHRTDAYPRELSGGEQQRVAIARALANSPRLLIADEPTGQLDSGTGRTIMTLIRALVKSEGVTAIVATHDPLLIDLADRIIELRDGEI